MYVCIFESTFCFKNIADIAKLIYTSGAYKQRILKILRTCIKNSSTLTLKTKRGLALENFLLLYYIPLMNSSVKNLIKLCSHFKGLKIRIFAKADIILWMQENINLAVHYILHK
jgi:hypothetical protein